MVKSGLEKTFLKFLHSGDYLILGTIHKRRRNILGEEGGSQIPMLQDIRKLGKSGSKLQHGRGGYQKRPLRLNQLGQIHWIKLIGSEL